MKVKFKARSGQYNPNLESTVTGIKLVNDEAGDAERITSTNSGFFDDGSKKLRWIVEFSDKPTSTLLYADWEFEAENE